MADTATRCRRAATVRERKCLGVAGDRSLTLAARFAHASPAVRAQLNGKALSDRASADLWGAWVGDHPAYPACRIDEVTSRSRFLAPDRVSSAPLRLLTPFRPTVPPGGGRPVGRVRRPASRGAGSGKVGDINGDGSDSGFWRLAPFRL